MKKLLLLLLTAQFIQPAFCEDLRAIEYFRIAEGKWNSTATSKHLPSGDSQTRDGKWEGRFSDDFSEFIVEGEIYKDNSPQYTLTFKFFYASDGNIHGIYTDTQGVRSEVVITFPDKSSYSYRSLHPDGSLKMEVNAKFSEDTIDSSFSFLTPEGQVYIKGSGRDTRQAQQGAAANP
jgi:hypothetical protein